MIHTLRARIHEILDTGGQSDPVSRSVDVFLITLISLNVLAIFLESEPTIGPVYAELFEKIELFSVAVFSIEYVMRFWSTVEDRRPEFQHPVTGRLRYLVTPMAIIDLLAILPFYLSFIVALDLRFLRVLRLLRVFKLTRYSSSMTLLLDVLRDEARPIGAALFVLLMMTVLAASFTYLAEHETQPDKFGSMFEATWWAVVTMTTVGYGDIVPVTAAGKMLGALIGIMGIGMVALPAGLLSSGFSKQLHQRESEYRSLVDDALQDGTADIWLGDGAQIHKEHLESCGTTAEVRR